MQHARKGISTLSVALNRIVGLSYRSMRGDRGTIYNSSRYILYFAAFLENINTLGFQMAMSGALTFVLDDKLGDAQCSISSHLHRSECSIGKTKLSQLPSSIARWVVAWRNSVTLQHAASISIGIPRIPCKYSNIKCCSLWLVTIKLPQIKTIGILPLHPEVQVRDPP